MTEIKRMLQTKEDNSKEQFYPETHVAGIVGLTEYVSGQLPTGVVSVNGKSGSVLLEADDIYAAKKNTQSRCGNIHYEWFYEFI